AAVHRLARAVPAAGRAHRLRRVADLAGRAEERAYRHRQGADGALGARRLPRAGLPHHDLAGADSACGVLRHPGLVDRALAV
nr:hypothetical protein [Tanacetum cinerariifolium]